MIKKILIILALFLAANLTGCSGSDTLAPSLGACPLTFAFVTDESGIINNPVNAEAWANIEEFAKLNNLGADCLTYNTAASSDKYVEVLRNATFDNKSLVIVANSSMEKALLEVAGENPDQKYLYLGKTIERSNVLRVEFSLTDGAFLSGITSALKGKEDLKNTYGFVSDDSDTKAFKAYSEGVNVIDPSAKVVKLDVDMTKAKVDYNSLVKSIVDQGVYVVFVSNNNIFTELTKQLVLLAEKDDKHYLINVGYDAFKAGMLTSGQSIVLTSVLYNYDTALKTIGTMLDDGTFRGGEVNHLEFSLINDGIYLELSENRNISKSIINVVEEYANRVKVGDITNK